MVLIDFANRVIVCPGCGKSDRWEPDESAQLYFCDHRAASGNSMIRVGYAVGMDEVMRTETAEGESVSDEPAVA